MSKYKIKVATEEDLPALVEMAVKFAESTAYAPLTSREKLQDYIQSLIQTPKDKAIIFIVEDKGFLVASASEFLVGKILQATELAWWVDPNHRRSKVGKLLLEAFEYWAVKIGAKIKVMSCLDKSVAKYYEKNGYKLYEKAYFKEV